MIYALLTPRPLLLKCVNSTWPVKCGMKLLIQSFGNGYVISTHILWWMQLLIHDGVKLIHVSERCPKKKIKRIVVIHYLSGHMRKSSITNYFAQLIRQYPFPSCCEVKGMFIVASTNDMQWYMYGLYYIMYFMVQHSWNGVYTWGKVNTGCVFFNLLDIPVKCLRTLVMNTPF